MQCRARKVFKSEYGMMRIGNIFTCEPSLAKEYARLGNIEILPDKFGDDRRTQALSAAPRIKEGKELPTENPPPSSNLTMADSKAAGLTTMPSASPRVPRSRRRT
jgi:hypothetical protein